MTDLEPCPFCGGEAEWDAEITEEYNGTSYRELILRCRNCLLIMSPMYGMSYDDSPEREERIRQDLIGRWNRRASE